MMAFARGTSLYVVDRNLHRVQKFTGTGVFLTKWGSFGTGEGQFNLPYAIRAGANDIVYVSDSSNFRVQKFAFPAPDGDGDIDLADFLAFTACFDGPATPTGDDCTAFDLDRDGDTDLADLVAFQAAFTGSEQDAQTGSADE